MSGSAARTSPSRRPRSTRVSIRWSVGGPFSSPAGFCGDSGLPTARTSCATRCSSPSAAASFYESPEVVVVDPCIPRHWERFEMRYRHGNSLYSIHVENPEGRLPGGLPAPARWSPALGRSAHSPVRRRPRAPGRGRPRIGNADASRAREPVPCAVLDKICLSSTLSNDRARTARESDRLARRPHDHTRSGPLLSRSPSRAQPEPLVRADLRRPGRQGTRTRGSWNTTKASGTVGRSSWTKRRGSRAASGARQRIQRSIRSPSVPRARRPTE